MPLRPILSLSLIHICQVPVGSLSYKTDQADTSVVLNPYDFDWQWQTEDGQTSTSQVDGSAADGNGTLNETIVDARIPNACLLYTSRCV